MLTQINVLSELNLYSPFCYTVGLRRNVRSLRFYHLHFNRVPFDSSSWFFQTSVSGLRRVKVCDIGRLSTGDLILVQTKSFLSKSAKYVVGGLCTTDENHFCIIILRRPSRPRFKL